MLSPSHLRTRLERVARRRASPPPWALLAAASLVGACGEPVGVEAASGGAERSGAATGAAATVGLREGDAAPDVTFTTLDGGRPGLRGLADAVLVSFWASDCAICLDEAPALAALRERFGPRGFELVSVAMPYDRPDFVLDRAGGWAHPVALDVDGAVLAAFEPVPGTPTGFLVGPAGTVLERWSGPADVAALARRLEALLPPSATAAPPPPPASAG